MDIIPLADGAVRLSRTRNVTAPRAPDQPARVITFAWGDRYVDDLLSLTVPALLAPGNLPALTGYFPTEFVIVTETRLFDTVKGSPAIEHVLDHCDVRLVPINDLLSHWYGITLTYALMRGFADLGPAATDTHLIFLNADFIVADGSYRTLAERIMAGARLAVAPSYCMILEETVTALRDRRDPETQRLAVPPRQLADLVIRHRHNTIRAKTVNQRLFRIHRYDQFYWLVDERTLAARQMPIAVVYMRPERLVSEMPTFWDYGVVSELCPTAQPYVFGDSDEFLMAELRTAGTFRDLLSPGWPTTQEIADDLSSFTTHDHRVYGRYPLLVHSGDLPSTVAEAQSKLAAFVDDVYRRLGPPLDYRDHPYWVTAYPRFKAMLAARRSERPEDARPSERPASMRTRYGLRNTCLEITQWLYRRLLGEVPSPNPWHPLHAPLMRLMERLPKGTERVLVVSSGGLLSGPLARAIPGRKLVITPEMVPTLDIRTTGTFDACVCDLGREHLYDLRDLLGALRRFVASSSTILVFHQVRRRADIRSNTYDFTRYVFPPDGSSEIVFTGSWSSSIAAEVFMRAAETTHLALVRNQVWTGLKIALVMPLARWASFIERRRRGATFPRHCTSLLMEVRTDDPSTGRSVA